MRLKRWLSILGNLLRSEKFMKPIILLIMLFVVSSIYGHTNVINIYNSKVTIQNTVTTVGTNVIVTRRSTNNLVVLPRYYFERLQWESMLEARKKASFNAYLRRIK